MLQYTDMDILVYHISGCVIIAYLLFSLGVRTVVQVLSESVAKDLSLTGRPEVEGTVEFADMFNKYLDILNVGNFDNGKRKRKRFHVQEPYRDASDFRLKVNTY